MPRQRFTAEQNIKKVHDVEVLVAKGATEVEASRQIADADELTSNRWAKEYSAEKVDQARRMMDLNAENNRLKKLIAKLNLEKMILTEASKSGF